MNSRIAKYLILFSLLFSPAFSQDPPPLPGAPITTPEFLHELEKKPPEDGSRFYQEFFKMLFVLGLLVAFLLLLTWFMKRMMNTRIMQQNVESDIKIIERRSLTPKTHIYILDIKGQTVVISDSINGVTRLAEIPEEGKRPRKEFSL